jgi:hypothetical protein
MNCKKVLAVLVPVCVLSCRSLTDLPTGEGGGIVVYKSSQRADTPGALKLQTGEIMVVFHEPTARFSSVGRILRTLSSDGGRTWTLPDTVVRSVRRCLGLFVLSLRSGAIIVGYGEAGDAVSGGNVFIARSFDNAKSFMVPRMIPLGDSGRLMTAGQMLEKDDGTLLLPIAVRSEGRKASAIIILSKDNGETWTEKRILAGDPENRIDFLDPALAVLPDGKLLAMMGSENAAPALFSVFSIDGGKTWSVPSPSGIQGTSPKLFVTSEGILICVFRDKWPSGISVVRSFDWGRTWEDEHPLLSREGNYAFSDVVECGGKSLIVHDEGRKGNGTENQTDRIRGIFFEVRTPDIPKAFGGSCSGPGGVRLRWNSVKGAKYYIVYRDEQPDFTLQPGYPFSGNGIASPVLGQYQDGTVNSGRTYYYRVTAVYGSEQPIPGTGAEGKPTPSVRIDVP